MGPLPDQVVERLVQEDGRIEEEEALDENEGNPDQGVRADPQPPRREREEDQLPRDHGDVPGGTTPVELAELVPSNALRQLPAEPT